MKLLTLFVLFAVACCAQMKALLINPNGSVRFVTLDPATIVVVNGVLIAKPPAQPVLAKRIVEITQVAVATATYTLGQAPNVAAPELDIFWNGICLSVGIDYTVAANVVTFTSGPGPGPGDVLRVVYRTL